MFEDSDESYWNSKWMLFENQGFCVQVTLRINTYDFFFFYWDDMKAVQAGNTVAVTEPIWMSKSRIMWFCVTKWKIFMCNTILNACIYGWHNFCSKYWTWAAMDFFLYSRKWYMESFIAVPGIAVNSIYSKPNPIVRLYTVMVKHRFISFVLIYVCISDF